MSRMRSIVPVFFTTLSLVAISISTSVILSGDASGVAMRAGDEILEIHDASLTTYVPTSKSNVQDIRSLVDQRGVAIDGSHRTGSSHGTLRANMNETPSMSPIHYQGEKVDQYHENPTRPRKTPSAPKHR